MGLYDILQGRMNPGGYNTQPGMNFNPRTLSGAGIGPIEPLAGLGGALKSRQMQQDMGNPVYQEMTPYQPMQYAGKASGAAGIGIGLKGIARFMQAIENTKALKLQQQRYQELYELAIQEKKSAMATEMLGKLAELQKLEAENNKTIQSFGDELSKTVTGMPEEQRGGYLSAQREQASGLYGEESQQVRMIDNYLMRAGMLAPGGEQEMTEAPSLDFSSMFPDVYDMEKKKAKSTKAGQEEAAQEAWETGGKKIFTEQATITQQQKAQAEQKFKSQEETEKNQILLEKAKADLKKKQMDIEDAEINAAAKIYLESPAIAVSLQHRSKDPGKMADEIGQVAKSLRKAKIQANPKRLEVYNQIASYGNKETAIQAISSKGLSEEAMQEALKMVDLIPWETLNPPEQ